VDEQSIFLSALEKKTPAERSVWLQECCGDDTALRQRVEELLRLHQASADFLEQPAPFPRPVAETAGRSEKLDYLREILAPASRPLWLGRIGQYDILSLVGSGAMGLVLQGREAVMQRSVAIKILQRQFAADPAARMRFLREARAMAAVKDLHVITIHAVGEHRIPRDDRDETIPYLVMELIAGQSLEQKIKAAAGPLQLKEILRIGAQIAQGLASAHQQGVIHRDIKPANILLENGVERVKITDFGLAYVVSDDVRLSIAGAVSGTPPFMSPEQAAGSQVDHRSDLFSLGSVLYAMCTGDAPFHGPNLMAIVQEVIHSRPIPIARRNLAIPAELCDIVAKLHQKDPGLRYQSAAEVAQHLESMLQRVQHETVVMAPPDVRSKPRKVARTLGLIAGMMAACLLVGILAFSRRQAVPQGSLTGTSPGQDQSAGSPAIAISPQEFVPPPETVSLVVDDSEANYQETQADGTPEFLGWKSGTDFELRDSAHSQSYRFNSKGAMTARWKFHDLPAGEYDVLLTWPAGPQFNALASYTLYDNAQRIRRHEVNQGKPPREYPRAEKYQSVDWMRLDTVRIESGTAVVELDSRLSRGGGVASDAVWLRSTTRTITRSSGH
jgi:serine/threonine protein kinase